MRIVNRTNCKAVLFYTIKNGGKKTNFDLKKLNPGPKTQE